jgi:hypothetical protein
MNAVRIAIKNSLIPDSTLLSLLGDGANSILAPGDVTSTTPKPFLILDYNGSIGSSYMAIQRWSTFCYFDPAVHNFNTSSLILKKVKDRLHRKTISVANTSGVQCAECEWFMDLPSDYDPLWNLYLEGHRYRIHVVDLSS